MSELAHLFHLLSIKIDLPIYYFPFVLCTSLLFFFTLFFIPNSLVTLFKLSISCYNHFWLSATTALSSAYLMVLIIRPPTEIPVYRLSLLAESGWPWKLWRLKLTGKYLLMIVKVWYSYWIMMAETSTHTFGFTFTFFSYSELWWDGLSLSEVLSL